MFGVVRLRASSVVTVVCDAEDAVDFVAAFGASGIVELGHEVGECRMGMVCSTEGEAHGEGVHELVNQCCDDGGGGGRRGPQ